MFSIRWSRPFVTGMALAAILSGGLAIRLSDLNRQGETWDEIAYFNAGKQVFNNLQHREFRAEFWDANFEHPPVGKFLYAIASLAAYRRGETTFVPGRLASAVVGMLTVWLVFLIGRRLGLSESDDVVSVARGDRVGLVAAGVLASLPFFLGYNLVLGLDTPTAFTFTLTVWLFLEALARHRTSWLVAAAVAAGLAIGTRLSNLLVLPTLMVIWLIWRTSTVKRQRYPLVEMISTAALFTVMPLAVVAASWPWLWTADWRAHLERTLGHWSPIKVVFLGDIAVAPVSYYLLYLGAVIPGLLLVALVWFVWRSLVTQRASWLSVLAWLVGLFAFSWFGVRQGGLRYLLALAPAIALAVGLVVDELMTQLPRRSDRIVLGAVLAGYLVVQLVASRPYYLDYYNELTGGPAVVAAHRWFQIGWWNEGVDEAVDWVNDHASNGATVTVITTPRRSDGRLRADLRRADHVEADYVIANPGYLWYRPRPVGLDDDFDVVYEVPARGAAIATVYQRVNQTTKLRPGTYEPINY